MLLRLYSSERAIDLVCEWYVNLGKGEQNCEQEYWKRAEKKGNELTNHQKLGSI
jgi:hypothetical protein